MTREILYIFLHICQYPVYYVYLKTIVMKHAVIIHGWGATSQNNFFPWLSNILQGKGYQVFVPDMPDTLYPDAYKWTDTILKYIQDKEEILLIGHSLGVATILNVLSQENCPSVDKVISIAGTTDLAYILLPKEEILPLENFYAQLPQWNWNTIREKVKTFIIMHSDNDYAVDLDDAKHLAKVLQADLHVFHKNHFNTFDIPEILPYI